MPSWSGMTSTFESAKCRDTAMWSISGSSNGRAMDELTITNICTDDIWIY